MDKTYWKGGRQMKVEKTEFLHVTVNTADLDESLNPNEKGSKTERMTSRDSKCDSHRFVRRAANFNKGHRPGGSARDFCTSRIFVNTP
jgi:deferrochelatase/peroxidase EfeB